MNEFERGTRTQRRQRQQEEELRQAKKRRFLLFTGGGLLLGLAILMVAVLTAPRTPTADVPPAGPSGGSIVAQWGVTAEGRTLGESSAPVTIDLWEDFQCPACKSWGDSQLPAVIAQDVASGNARIVFHDFAFLGPDSERAARAAWAAEQQGFFWDYYATLYANQGAENSGVYSESRLIEMARLTGLNEDRFREDLNSDAAKQAVANSNDQAQQTGVNSTPTVVINGQNLSAASAEQIHDVVLQLSSAP